MTKLAALDKQEDQLLDLVDDADWPKEKIAQTLRGIRAQRARLPGQPDRTERPDLDAGRAAITAVMDMLTQPGTLYQQAGEDNRRALNRAFFRALHRRPPRRAVRRLRRTD